MTLGEWILNPASLTDLDWAFIAKHYAGDNASSVDFKMLLYTGFFLMIALSSSTI